MKKMGSPHIGHDELIKIKTDKMTLVIKGPRCHPKLVEKQKSGQKTSVRIRCRDPFSVRVVEQDQTTDIEPLFFEQQTYQFAIQYNKELDLVFWHENSNIRESITKLDEAEDSEKITLLGPINFRNNIGFSDFIVKNGGDEYLKLSVEVFPIKLDYKDDYDAIMHDIIEESYRLLFDFLKETYRSFNIEPRNNNSLVEFFTIIKYIYADYIKAIDLVINRPHHILQTNHEVIRSYSAKRIDTKSIRWLEHHSEHVSFNGSLINADKVLAQKKEIIFDTKENQFAKFIVRSTIKRLIDFKRNYYRLQRVEKKGTDEFVIEELQTMITGLTRRLNGSFLRDISEFKGQNQMSLVFTMAPGYRDLYRYHLMLQHGLSLMGDVFRLSLKDMAELYEYWCFVKLNSILRNKYELISHDRIRITQDGLFSSLVKNKKKSKVVYKNEKNEEITLTYNPSGEYPTGPQKPDNVLSLKKQGTNIKYEYVFDAKYRMNPAQKETYYYNVYKYPGPEEDDINTMHRYRDAIVAQHLKSAPYERLMFGAYVLFPLSGKEEIIQYQNYHMLYKSIEEVNIGGLPFLPSSTELVEKQLDILINEDNMEAENRAVYPIGSAEMLDIYHAFKELTKTEQQAVLFNLKKNGIGVELETFLKGAN